jgi:predicted transcriptional regulator
MQAISIRQPYAELILRGIKPIEFRSRPTRIIGERFYIYASKQWAVIADGSIRTFMGAGKSTESHSNSGVSYPSSR